MAQVVDCLPSKHKALNSNSVPPKKQTKNGAVTKNKSRKTEIPTMSDIKQIELFYIAVGMQNATEVLWKTI
jgi:hypothetical protein